MGGGLDLMDSDQRFSPAERPNRWDLPESRSTAPSTCEMTMARSGNNPILSIQIGEGALNPVVGCQERARNSLSAGLISPGSGSQYRFMKNGFAGAGPDDEHIHCPTETADDTTVEPNRFSEPFSQHPELFDAGQRRISVHSSQGIPGHFAPS